MSKSRDTIKKEVNRKLMRYYKITEGKPQFVVLDRQLLNSKAYQSLSSSERDLLVWCMDQYTTNKLNPIKLNETADTFYFHLTKAVWGKVYNSPTSATKGIRNLIIFGFIDCVYDGKPRQEMSIYRYSERWKRAEGSRCLQILLPMDTEHCPATMRAAYLNGKLEIPKIVRVVP